MSGRKSESIDDTVTTGSLMTLLAFAFLFPDWLTLLPETLITS
jgi:hypothetical protein